MDGKTPYSPIAYDNAVDKLKSTGKTFARSSAAADSGDYTGSIAGILDPRKLKNGMRESCFRDGFNDVTPVVVSIDCTGSMHQVPSDIRDGLPKLIDLLIEQSISDNPNIMFIGHDDEYSVPLAAFQMSQFEIGSEELVTALNEMVIPGMGGGNQGEGYHLAFYAAANHTRLESFERDGTKGFLFMICDEQPYYDAADPAKHGTTPHIAKEVFGDVIEAEVTMLASVRKTCERYHVFIIRPGHTSHGTDRSITQTWQKLLRDAGENPENVMEIPETDAIISTMALAIGRLAGVNNDSLVEVLRAKGATGVDAAVSATNALVPRAGTGMMSQSSAPLATSDDDAKGRSRRT